MPAASFSVFLLRHTRVADSSLCYGHHDVALAATAAADMATVAARLPALLGRPVAAPAPAVLLASAAPAGTRYPFQIINSPATRCRQLAEVLARELPAAETIRPDERLREMNFGAWEGRPWAGIAPAELNPWMADYVKLAPPGGETFQQLQDRAAALLAELTAADTPTLLVTHAGLIRALLCHCLEMPLRHAFRLSVDFGSVTELRWQGSNWQVLGVNR